MKYLIFTLFSFGLPTLMAQSSERGIQVTGSAERTLQPDIILLDIAISAESESASEAQKETNRKAEIIIKYLRGTEGVKKVETSHLYLRPIYMGESRKEPRYHSSQGLSFRITDMQAYDKIMSGLLERGVNEISSIRFDSSQRTEMERELLAEAIADAKEKAGFMALQLQQEAGKALFITDLQNNFSGPMMYKQMDMMESSGIAPRELKIRAEVSILFELN